jgi:hypothetical protein
VFAKEFGEHVYVRIGADIEREREKIDKNSIRVDVEMSRV